MSLYYESNVIVRQFYPIWRARPCAWERSEWSKERGEKSLIGWQGAVQRWCSHLPLPHAWDNWQIRISSPHLATSVQSLLFFLPCPSYLFLFPVTSIADCWCCIIAESRLWSNLMMSDSTFLGTVSASASAVWDNRPCLHLAWASVGYYFCGSFFINQRLCVPHKQWRHFVWVIN